MAAVVGAALLLLLLLVGGALWYLNSAAGGDRVRQEALSVLKELLQGEVKVGQLAVRGEEIVLRDLELYDPEQRLVARIAEVRLRLSLTALVRREIVVREAIIRQPQLHLVSDERGFNLARAVASKKAEMEQIAPADKKPSRLAFQVQALTIEGGSLDFTRQGEERDVKVALDGLGGEGEARWSGPDEKLKAQLKLRARQRQPQDGDVQLTAQVEMAGRSLHGAVALQAPGVVLDVSGGQEAAKEGEAGTPAAARVEVKVARVDPETARAYVDRYPVQVPVLLSGTADLHGGVLQARLDGTAGRGQVELRGSLDVKRLWSDGVTLAARGLDLSELTPDGPSTSLQLDLTARGGGRSLETLEGEVKLSVPPSKVRSETLGPVQLTASADKGHFKLPRFRASLPGVVVEASGEGTLERVSLTGDIRAPDLGDLARALVRLRPGQALPLDGQGHLAFQVEGPLRHPGVSASGEFASLRYEENAVLGLDLTADMADVTRPLTAEATLQAAEVRAGGRTFRRVLAQVASEGADVIADARFTPLIPDGEGGQREAGELALRVAGQRDKDSRGLLVREMTLRYPEATWALQRPAQVAFRDGFSAEQLYLVSGTQELAVEGKVARGAMDVVAQARRLDLKLLPGAFVDRSLDLAGLLSFTVRARGRTSNLAALEAEAEVELDGGRVKRFDALGLTLAGRYSRDRAEGTLRFTSRMARLSARFNLPVQGTIRRRHEPVEAFFQLDPQSIGGALAALGERESVTGIAGVSLTVMGTADDPAARLSISARDLRLVDYPQVQLRDPTVDLAVDSGQGGKLQARLEVEAEGMATEVAVRTPFTLPELLDRTPDVEALKAAAYEVDASLRGLRLELLQAAGVEGLRGRASLRAEVRGTMKAATVNARLEGRGVSRGQTPPADVAVDLVAGERDVAAALQARRGNQVLADLVARAGAPLGAMTGARALEEVPLAVDGTVGPVSLAEWLPPSPDEDEESARTAPAGQVAVRVRARGTLADPRLELVSSLEQLRVGEACIGRGAVSYRYARAVSTVAASLSSSGQGRATVDGTLKLDLSLPAIRRGLKPGSAPVEAALRAEGFELGILSGLVPTVRAISGKLSADARVRGTLDSPGQQGWVEWRDGALALDGYGDYRAVQVRADATGDTFKLSRFEAQSGAGTLWVNATAARSGGRFLITGEAKAQKFPIVYDDQMYAVLSTRLTLQGELTSRVLDMREINVPEAHVELPDVKRKDLQDIDRPDDIVLVRRGKPVKKRKQPAPQEAPAGGTAQAQAQGAPAQGPAAQGQGQGGSPPVDGGGATGRRYAFTIQAPRNVWIRSSDVNMEIGLSDGFRVEYEGRSRIFGDVRIVRGRAEVLGREFEVQRNSVVTFSGQVKKPDINVTAIHVNQREQVTVFMTVNGKGKDVAIKTSSQPPMTESEIYTLLATGRRTLKTGGGTAIGGEQAVSALGSVAVSQLKGAIASKLPLDVLSIETGSEGLKGTRLEVGTYLSDKAYVGGVVRPGAEPSQDENKFGFRFEYQLTPHVGFQAEYGDARSGGADVVWSRDY